VQYKQHRKPLVFSIFGGEKTEPCLSRLKRTNAAVYGDVYEAVACMGAAYSFYRYRMESSSEMAEAEIDAAAIDQIIAGALAEGRTFLLANEGQAVMRAAGILIPQSKIAHSLDEAVRAAEEIGYPVVMIVVSRDILHKSDAGGVALDLMDRNEVIDAYQAILRNCRAYKADAAIDGVEVSQMVKMGTETIVGARRDATFGPIIMFVLAWTFLPDQDGYRTGLIITGLARCIAMVLIWNMLAGGDSEYCAVLVALNSVFQIIMYSPLAYFYLRIVPEWFGLPGTTVNIGMGDIAKSVLIFLGIPLAAGIIPRFTMIRRRGKEWYETRLMPRLGPTALLGLLFTIVVMFAMQGDRILSQPWDVVRVAAPLVVYFIVMFFTSFALSIRLTFPYELAATQSFTAASNNFELAIAVAIGTFTIASPEALATR